MHLSTARLRRFRRFADLDLQVPGTPRLVMLCGPNGSGKSSLFDAIRWRYAVDSGTAGNQDFDYYLRAGPTREALGFDMHAFSEVNQSVELTYHEGEATGAGAVYARSAYRNEPDFTSHLQGGMPFNPSAPNGRMIDNDARASENYRQLFASTIEALYNGEHDEASGRDIRDALVGDVRVALRSVYPHLDLVGLANPAAGGTFRFSKGTSTNYAYKNLSGGEKAVFDLLLDVVARRPEHRRALYCFDEPEAHINPGVQGALFDALLALIPDGSQIWFATHSAAFMRRALDLHREKPESVAFLDFDQDFDRRVELSPSTPDRAFWRRALNVAFGDMAELVAPGTLVLCEGSHDGADRKDFDASCLSTIFAARHPEAEFVSVGNDREVQDDSARVGAAAEALSPGTRVLRVVDRDARSDEEVARAVARGTSVLRRRNLESYLLDEEVLDALCRQHGKDDLIGKVRAERARAIDKLEGRNPPKPRDDLKACRRDIHVAVVRTLGLTNAGATADAFLRDTLAPLLTEGMACYAELEESVFGSDTPASPTSAPADGR